MTDDQLPTETGIRDKTAPASVTARMRDVARRAQVSPATVSRVLNGSTKVNAAYRARVLRAMEELGYRPNLLARNLRRQKADMIGLLVSDIENPHFTELVRAIEDAAYHLGYRVLLCNTDESPEKQSSYLEVLADQRVLGVILSPHQASSPEVSYLLDLGIPVVAFDRPLDDPRADAVLLDNRRAGLQLTQYLIEAGHRQIGFISDPDIASGVERLAGYEQAMSDAQLTPYSLSGSSRIEEGYKAMEELLRTQTLTAVAISNNLMTIGALRCLHSHKLRVPDDLSLVAIDDPFWSELIAPPLTVLAQPIRRMAEQIIGLLLERIEAERPEARRLVFTGDLIVRDSVRRLSP